MVGRNHHTAVQPRSHHRLDKLSDVSDGIHPTGGTGLQGGQRGRFQAQLGRKLGLHQKQISGYERSVHTPSVEALIKIAKALEVSLDYLAFDDHGEPQRTPISDRQLFDQLEEIDKLSDADKAIVKGVLETFIVKSRFRRLTVETG